MEEELVETLSDGTKIINTNLSNIVTKKAIRNHFNSLFKYKDDIRTTFDSIKNNPEIKEFCRKISSKEYRVINKNNLKLPCIFKYEGGTKIKFFNEYNARHLRSSIIKNVLLDNNDLDKKSTIVTYLLYYYWFNNKDNMNDVTRCVLTDIENIISTIIDRSTKDLKHIDTNNLVKSLRDKWNSEKLLSMV